MGVTQWVSQSELADLTDDWWPWWVMIPIEGFTDVTLAIEDTDKGDEGHEGDVGDEDDEGDVMKVMKM